MMGLFSPEEEETTGGLKKLQNEKVRILYYYNTITAMK
jgi:hypothetical protein